MSHPYAAVWLGVGSGKTFTVLRALQTLRPQGHVLVIAPPAIARSVWVDEILKWRLGVRARSLVVNDRDRTLTRAQRLERYREVLTDPPTVYFISEDLIDDLVEQMPSTTVSTGLPAGLPTGLPTGLSTDQGGVARVITWPFGTVVIDESQGFKSETSRRFLALASVRGAIHRLIELSGTPAPNGLLDLWSQVYLLDQGRSLGATKADYIARWFDPIRYINDRPVTWAPKPGAEAEIYAAIAPLAISATNTTLAMPEVSIEDVPVTLPADLLQAYRDFKRDLVLDIVTTAAATAQAELDTDGDASNTQGQPAGSSPFEPEDRAAWIRQRVVRIVADNAAILTGKLMQFASGTMYTDPEDPTRPYEVLHSAKLEMTDYIVRNSANSPVLVAYHYRSDLHELTRYLTRAGHHTELFDGSREMVRRWNAREIAVMLLHPASAGHGLNLQHGGSRMIWYTLPFSLGHYIQTNGRLRRPGQTEQVTIHRLLTTGTYDTRMPAILAAKRRIQDNLVSSVDANSAPVVASTTGLDPIHLGNTEDLSSPDAPGTGDPEAKALAAEIAEDLRESLETVMKEQM